MYTSGKVPCSLLRLSVLRADFPTDNVWWCVFALNVNMPCTGSSLQPVFKRFLRWLGLMEAAFMGIAFTSELLHSRHPGSYDQAAGRWGTSAY